MEQGTVSRYFREKRYGFIDDGRGGSLFFHLNSRDFGTSDPSPGESLLFERDIDKQGRKYASRWIAARDVAGLVELSGCFLTPDALNLYPFLRTIMEAHSIRTRRTERGIYSVTTKSLALELPVLKKRQPQTNVSPLWSFYHYVYVIAQGKQPVELERSEFILDDVIQAGPSVAEELTRLRYSDSDITAIVWIATSGSGRESKHTITVYI